MRILFLILPLDLGVGGFVEGTEVHVVAVGTLAPGSPETVFELLLTPTREVVVDDDFAGGGTAPTLTLAELVEVDDGQFNDVLVLVHDFSPGRV